MHAGYRQASSERSPLEFKEEQMFVICSWCGRARCCDGTWRFLCPEDPVWDGAMASHGICPDCALKKDYE